MSEEARGEEEEEGEEGMGGEGEGEEEAAKGESAGTEADREPARERLPGDTATVLPRLSAAGSSDSTDWS